MSEIDLSVKEILAPLGLERGTGFFGKATREKINKTYGCGISSPATPAIPATPAMPITPVTPTTPATPATPVSCTDSDGGKNYYIKGTTIGLASDGVITTRIDSCWEPNYYGDGYDYIAEWFCADGYAINTNEKCIYGCKDGACLSSITPTSDQGGLIAHWKFDEGSGNTVYDYSGNGNTGLVYGAK